MLWNYIYLFFINIKEMRSIKEGLLGVLKAMEIKAIIFIMPIVEEEVM